MHQVFGVNGLKGALNSGEADVEPMSRTFGLFDLQLVSPCATVWGTANNVNAIMPLSLIRTETPLCSPTSKRRAQGTRTGRGDPSWSRPSRISGDVSRWVILKRESFGGRTEKCQRYTSRRSGCVFSADVCHQVTVRHGSTHSHSAL
jgi:hypothetical protein